MSFSSRHFAREERHHDAMIRSTVTPTILKAGFRANVIPSEAEATLDVGTRSRPCRGTRENLVRVQRSLFRMACGISSNLPPTERNRL